MKAGRRVQGATARFDGYAGGWRITSEWSAEVPDSRPVPSVDVHYDRRGAGPRFTFYAAKRPELLALIAVTRAEYDPAAAA